ncbi:MAG TPA: ABC transporter ATP-binding protein [Thermoanaerobaculia bacterium]|jgi:ABC-2 type transport system ATP-binding protein|nr:ABC transporter ATP-binding protein [Thermoanaerobaculia bacterium]
MPAAPLPLEIRELSKSFAGRRALDGVTLSLSPGEILGLLGPNGAGKTTLVRSVAGRVRPDGGTLRIFGMEPFRDEARSARGWVPQEIALYPLLSPVENLWTFGRYQGLSGAALEAGIRKSLDWIGLADRAHEKTEKLSGGMKRRLNIAAGTIHGPRVLLLDEPTVGVDPQSRERIYAMIGELKAAGVSLLYTTHYMEEAERLCDRIAIIDHGRIIESGTKDDLVRKTVGGRQTLIVEAASALPAALAAELSRRGGQVEGAIVRMPVASAGDEVRGVLDRFHGANVPVLNLTLKSPTLEQVFLQLTGRELRE